VQKQIPHRITFEVINKKKKQHETCVASFMTIKKQTETT